jgi:hypothetical protein
MPDLYNRMNVDAKGWVKEKEKEEGGGGGARAW